LKQPEQFRRDCVALIRSGSKLVLLTKPRENASRRTRFVRKARSLTTDADIHMNLLGIRLI
jgi:hypothetical protein